MHPVQYILTNGCMPHDRRTHLIGCPYHRYTPIEWVQYTGCMQDSLKNLLGTQVQKSAKKESNFKEETDGS
jgi:hypothetical protein